MIGSAAAVINLNEADNDAAPAVRYLKKLNLNNLLVQVCLKIFNIP